MDAFLQKAHEDKARRECLAGRPLCASEGCSQRATDAYNMGCPGINVYMTPVCKRHLAALQERDARHNQELRRRGFNA